jgi:hypothetical protein
MKEKKEMPMSGAAKAKAILAKRDCEMNNYQRSNEDEKQMGQTTAARFDSGKIRHDLIPPYPLDELAKVYTYGARKYDPDNYFKGMAWRKVIGPLLRHLWKWIRGEKYDDESGLHHLSHVAWNVFTLMIYEKNNVGIDDRHPYMLDLLDEKESQKRVSKWKWLVKNNKAEEYNGLDCD